jgi:hypothetical protein
MGRPVQGRREDKRNNRAAEATFSLSFLYWLASAEKIKKICNHAKALASADSAVEAYTNNSPTQSAIMLRLMINHAASMISIHINLT